MSIVFWVFLALAGFLSWAVGFQPWGMLALAGSMGLISAIRLTGVKQRKEISRSMQTAALVMYLIMGGIFIWLGLDPPMGPVMWDYIGIILAMVIPPVFVLAKFPRKEEPIRSDALS
jgi:hypothetical protein